MPLFRSAIESRRDDIIARRGVDIYNAMLADSMPDDPLAPTPANEPAVKERVRVSENEASAAKAAADHEVRLAAATAQVMLNNAGLTPWQARERARQALWQEEKGALVARLNAIPLPGSDAVAAVGPEGETLAEMKARVLGTGLPGAKSPEDDAAKRVADDQSLIEDALARSRAERRQVK